MNNKRKVIYLVLLTFLFSLIPAFSVETLAADDINIISDTEISLEAAKEWAKGKNATDTFISLADLYYKYYKDHGNVNPAVAYAQAAVETGYGHFTGVIDESYHNPCGMKVTLGGDNTDPNAHYRFSSWDEGVQAQLDHLALYAGASGYPRASTYDPRHFSYIAGKAKTVIGLSNSWATSGTYAQTIMKLYNELLDKQKTINPTNPTNPSGPTNPSSTNNDILYSIDSVKYYTNNRFQLAGWILCGQDIQKVDFYMNNTLKGSFTPNIQREDVYKAYPSFNQHASGFNLVTDISDITDGTKDIKFVVTTTAGKTIEKTATFTVGRKSNFLVAVDPGHCNGTDGGATATVDGVNYSETQINLEIGLKLRERLEAYGYRTVITRENNNQIGSNLSESLKYRADLANNSNANLFLSIHQNSYNGTVAGTEGFYYPGNEKAKELVAAITKNVSQILGNNDRGPKPDTQTNVGSLYVIRNTNMPSVLIECGFIDNRNDATKLVNSDYQYKIADAIVNAVISVYGKPQVFEAGEPDPSSPVKEPAANPGTNTPGTNTPGTNTPGTNTPGEKDQTNPPVNNTGGENNTNPPANNTGGENNTNPPANNQGGNGGSSQPTFDSSNIIIMIVMLFASVTVVVKFKKAN